MPGLVKVFGRRPSRTFPRALRPAFENLQGTKPRERARIGRCRALSYGDLAGGGPLLRSTARSAERWGWRCSSGARRFSDLGAGAWLQIAAAGGWWMAQWRGGCRGPLESAGERGGVSDGVEALRQHMHQEAADELVGIERHHAVSLGTFDAVILPLEGDAAVVERDQAAVGDGDPMGIAGEIAQYFLGPPEWAFAVDHPFAVAQRCQIGREGSRISERGMVAEEL